MLTSAEVNREIYRQAEREAKKWFRAQIANPYARFYLYCKRGTSESWGDMQITENKPANDYELAWNERVSPAQSIEDVIRWVIHRAQSLPILKLVPFDANDLTKG